MTVSITDTQNVIADRIVARHHRGRSGVELRAVGDGNIAIGGSTSNNINVRSHRRD